MKFFKEFLSELEDPMPLPEWLQWGQRPIMQAFILSVMLHFVVIVGWECAFQMGIVRVRPSAALQEMLTPAEAKLSSEQLLEEQEVPLTFIEVDPQEEVEPPPDAQYYSSASTRASNPEPVIVSQEKAKVQGVEQEIVRTMEKMRQEPQEMNPIQEESGEQVHEEREPEPSSKPLFAAKPSDLGVGNAQEKPRPRTLKEARKNITLVGSPTLQEGGVRRHSLMAQMDVRGTPFGNYDAAFIAAVQKRWYDLIDESGMVTGAGKVVVVFKLHQDGRITDVQELSSSVGSLQSLLCQKAITDPSPYSPWPSELRKAMQGSERDVKFTFYYR